MATQATTQDLGSREVDRGYTYPFTAIPNAITSLALGHQAGNNERVALAVNMQQQRDNMLQKRDANLVQLLPAMVKAGVLGPNQMGGQGDFQAMGIPWDYKTPPNYGGMLTGVGGMGNVPVNSLEDVSRITTIQKNVDDLQNRGYKRTLGFIDKFPLVKTQLEKDLIMQLRGSQTGQVDSKDLNDTMKRLFDLEGKFKKAIQDERPASIPVEFWDSMDPETKRQFVVMWNSAEDWERDDFIETNIKPMSNQ